jgi:hypothetical protein
MSIKFCGFELDLHPKVTFALLLGQLKSVAGTRVEYNKFPRVLAVHETPTFLLGSVWTDRGDTEYPQIDATTNKMSVGRLEPGKHLSAFNFFVVSTKTYRGLVTQSEAGGVSLLEGLLCRCADQVRVVERAKAVAALGPNPSDAARKRAAAPYKGEALRAKHLMNRRQLEAVLREFKRIRSLAVRFKAVSEDRGKVRDPFIQTEEKKVTFVADCDRAALARHVVGLATTEGADADAVFVEGVNGDGFQLRFEVEKIPDWFGGVGRKAVIDDANLFAEHLPDATLIRRLLDVARQKPALF